MITMLGREREPLERLNPAFRRVRITEVQALAMALQAEMEVGGGMALFGRAQEPFAGLLEVARDALAALIEKSEIILRRGIAPVRGAAETTCGGLVARPTVSGTDVNDAQVVLGSRAFAFGSGQELGWSGGRAS